MPSIIEPGKTIGILGGGQLGRLLAISAGKMGYKTHIFCPEKNCPASYVATVHTCKNYDNEKALTEFASKVDVVTYEFENIPLETALFLSRITIVRPETQLLEISQDRIKEKIFFSNLKIPTAEWIPINNESELIKASNVIGLPSILKTSKSGYDGKGQIRLKVIKDISNSWTELTNDKNLRIKTNPFALLEKLIKFECEISVIVARDIYGNTFCFEPTENVHKDQILVSSKVPAKINKSIANEAMTISENAARSINLVGILAIEMFVDKNGKLIINEMAPRPHNSGHWTMDACNPDQFSQLVRAICGLKIEKPIRHYDAKMINLIGDDIKKLNEFYDQPKCIIYHYNKSSIRPKRKMGHITWLNKKTSLE